VTSPAFCGAPSEIVSNICAIALASALIDPLQPASVSARKQKTYDGTRLM